MEYRVVGVIFEITKKRYFFEVKEEEQYKRGDKVIVDTARGKELGVIYAEPMVLAEDKVVLPLKPVVKAATQEDVERFEELKKDAEKAQETCRKKVLEHKLQMKLVATEFTFDKTKLIFYFTAEGRVDFRALVKDLASIFRLRIELRQIGVRDEARILGRIGICGQDLCCRSYINKFDSVSIKMARDQGLVINPSKISGTCGRLLCCIRYEYKQYEEELQHFPALGQSVETEAGKAKVTTLNPLNGYLYGYIEEKGIMKFTLDEIKFDMAEAIALKNETSGPHHDEKEVKELESEE